MYSGEGTHQKLFGNLKETDNMKKIFDKIIKLVPLNVWKKIPNVFRLMLWIKSKL